MSAAAPVAAQVVDQQQTNVAALSLGRTGSDTGPNGGSNGWYVQAFIPTLATAAGAGFLLAPVQAGPTSGTLQVQLWNAQPSTTATMLASGTAALGSTYQYYTAFWNAVAVTPGTQYFLAFYSAQPYAVSGDYGHAGQPLGYNFSNTVTDPNQSNHCCTAAFQEYAIGPAASPPSTTAPEPSTWALVAGGLGTLGAVARRRARA